MGIKCCSKCDKNNGIGFRGRDLGVMNLTITTVTRSTFGDSYEWQISHIFHFTYWFQCRYHVKISAF